MTRPALYIRLIIATIAAMASAVFVWAYTPTSMQIIRGRLGKGFVGFPRVTEFIAGLSWHPILIPAILLIIGIFIIHRSKSAAAYELVVGCLWLFAFLWLAWCLFVCTLSEIQMISPLYGPSSDSIHGE
jgi:hypothetical protein